MNKVFKVALKLAQLTVPGKIVKARLIVSSMTDNAVVFANPLPALADITLAADALEKAYNASRGGDTEATAAMYEKEGVFDRMLTILAHYVESVANLNPATGDSIILSSGIDVKSDSTKPNNGFRGVSTINPGEVWLRTPSVGRGSYGWEYSPADSPVPQWTEAAKTLQASVYVKGLVSAKKYLFRVAVITKSGQGPWSDPISVVVG